MVERKESEGVWEMLVLGLEYGIGMDQLMSLATDGRAYSGTR